MDTHTDVPDVLATVSDSDLGTQSLIADLEGLFLKSGMLDDLRDTAKFLYKSGTVDKRTVSALVKRYTVLRDDLARTVVPGRAEELVSWSVDLEDDSPIDLVVLAASQLARWMDLLHQTPDFMLSQQVRAVNHLEVTGKLDEVQSKRSGSKPLELTSKQGLYL